MFDSSALPNACSLSHSPVLKSGISDLNFTENIFKSLKIKKILAKWFSLCRFINPTDYSVLLLVCLPKPMDQWTEVAKHRTSIEFSRAGESLKSIQPRNGYKSFYLTLKMSKEQFLLISLEIF